MTASHSEILKGTLTQNVLPSLTLLSTPISPSSAVASFRQIASPKPVPPDRRDAKLSTWTKALKRRVCPLSEIPMPLSLTERLSQLPIGSAFTSMLPRSEEHTSELQS